MDNKYNKQVNKSSSFAGWLDDFVKGLTPKKEVVAQDNSVNKVAEISIQDLPKVVWKDETFHVNFTEAGASILNQFGNTVADIPGVKTIEEVDTQLNAQQIIAEEEDEEGLKPVEADFENDFEDNAVQIDSIPEEADEVVDPNEFSNELEKVVANIDDQAEVEVEVGNDNDEVLEAIIAGFGELENKITSFEKKLAVVEQMYARTTDFAITDTNSQELEVQHCTETSDMTSKEIEKEKNIDISTPEGRYELSINNEEPSEVEQLVTDETNEPETNDEVTEENSPTEEVEENVDSEDVKEDSVEKISGVQERIFQQGICPITGFELVKANKIVGNLQGIYSVEGGMEYAVNLDTGDIYKYNGEKS